MALNKKDLFTLGKLLAQGDKKVKTSFSFQDQEFTYEQLDNTMRAELNALAGTYADFRENKNLIFALMEQIIDDVLPKRVMEQYAQFANIKVFKQGDKPIFVQKITNAARRRAKQFITKVGLAGIYEVFKLDGRSYEVVTSAYGGAAQIGLEEYLDGRIQMSDVLDIVLEGLDEAVYKEIMRALETAANNLVTSASGSKHPHVATANGFDEALFDSLLATASALGQPVIYCTFDFAAKMLPAEAYTSDRMRDERWANGYLTTYKGNHKVIVLDQSFTDETLTTPVVDSSLCYIIPAGAADKPVSIAVEGQAIVDEYVNKDRSREIQIYKKFGVAMTSTDALFIYKDTSSN